MHSFFLLLQNSSLCIKDKYFKIQFRPNFVNNRPLFNTIFKVVSNVSSVTEQQTVRELNQFLVQGPSLGPSDCIKNLQS